MLHATVDRTGFDPATVRASASAAADDQVNGDLVNGVSANGVRAAVGAGLALRSSRCAERHGFPSPGRWHAGVSDVDALGDDSPGRHSTNRAS